jgi:hypothetical protein
MVKEWVSHLQREMHRIAIKLTQEAREPETDNVN